MSLAPIAKDMLDHLTDIDLVVEEEIHKLPPCEGRTHPEGLNGHVPDQSASYIVGTPCGWVPYMCAGWVEAPVPDAYSGQMLACRCGTKHSWEALSIIPLGREA